jgi:oxaloacetate decarboxylase alpha subunit
MTRTIGLVDTTVRDGNQSLWSATALNTAMMTSIAPVMDRVGYHAIDFTSSTHMAVALRWHRDDPWQRIRAMRELMPNTRLGFITPGRRFMTWEQAPEDVMRLVFECIARAGIRRVWAIDPLNNMDAAVKVAGWCKDAGVEEVVVGIVYAVSPVHTDAYFAERAREVAASPHVDVLNLKDPGGLLTPDRIRSLAPIFREAAGPELPVEVHSHCTGALAPLVYLEAAELGVDFLCTAAKPLSNGTSQPSVEQTTANLRTRGFTTGLDEEAIARVSSHFREIAARQGLPEGRPVEHDASLYQHQLPGGMTTTLQRHLQEAGFEGRWEDLLEEVGRVRAELGYPHMVTPVSQFICVQAANNVTGGDRWGQLQDELVKYALGQYGKPPGEMDPDVKAKLLASPRAEDFANAGTSFDLGEARERWPDVDDEELLLRMMLPEGQVEAMISERDSEPAKDWAVIQHPLKTLVAELGKRPGVRSATVEADGARVHVERSGAT